MLTQGDNMKQLKSMLGVTLLEIMLVLAIAAMVIVMSIRYYQSATLSQQVNQTLGQIQAITAAADNLAIATGSYSSSITSAAMTAVVGANNMKTVTNQPITVTGASATTYTVSMPLNDNICASVFPKLAATKKIIATPCVAGTGTLSYTYDNTLSN
jgi:type II secretory pathway pseudopilin PulG